MEKNSSMQLSPAISVIIPLYNAEKYIKECLDSLLEQTFQDFELILVDDCSTDSSCEIVESYVVKFNERLRLYHTEKNSGSGAIARNIGLSYAKGEYIFNMDNDDMLTKTGLEEMYNLAKEYDADVVYCEKYYMSSGIGEEFVKNIHLADSRIQRPPFVDKPTFETEDLSERVQNILTRRFWVAPWQKLVRHDILNKHNLVFPPLKISDDDIWTYALVFFAKKFLRVPNMVYIRRMRKDSLSIIKRTPQQTIKFWLNPILLGLKVLDKYMSEVEFFEKNSQQRYIIFEKFLQEKLNASFISAGQLSPVDVYDTIKNEFGDDFGEYAALVSALCTHISNQHKSLTAKDKKIEDDTDIVKKDKELIAKQAEEIKRLKTKINSMSSLPDSRLICPEISVIIPMYNVEKYVGECLDSLFEQTFQDFEVIVVDDCSTDNSVAVVESYLQKFYGRLQIFKLKEKSAGGGSVPRNKGLELSLGKYVFFLDADDTITPTAFDEIYKIAEEYNADVVHCEKFYKVPEKIWNDKEEIMKLKPDNHFTTGRLNVTAPTLLSDNISERVQMFADKKLIWNFWAQLVRRDFIIENEIKLPDAMAQDMLFTMCSLCCAKKYVVVPNVINFYRVRENSVTMENVSQNYTNRLRKWLNVIRVDVEYINNFFAKRKSLSNQTDLKYILLNTLMKQMISGLDLVYLNYPPSLFEEVLQKEFSNNNDARFTTFIFNIMNIYRLQWKLSQKFIDVSENDVDLLQFKTNLTARIDIRLASKANKEDFQVFSVSDNHAKVSKPAWLNKGSVGYMITSYEGKIEFVIKATADEKIILDLKGLDIRDPKDKSKRIPYWIDYTKLAVNGKTIFDKLTPTWHDKSYHYTMDVRADEEIPIQIEWLPHRGDVLPEISKAKEKVKPVTVKFPSEQVKPTTVKFPPKLTARVDVELTPKTTGGDFQILSVSDDRAKIFKPDFLNKDDDIGYQIQSYNGKMEFVAKSTTDGQLRLKFKGMDIRDPKDKSKRVPYWIDYSTLTINGKKIFDKLTPTWHDKPYRYTIDVKAGEEIPIQMEWLPHEGDILPDKSEDKPATIKFPPDLTARLDVQLVPETEDADFQILSVSDDKAMVIKPDWLNKDGIGYQIQSYDGNLKFLAKATANGRITLKLKGMDIRDPKDKSKRVPYWIDYTKLTINGKKIFDKIKPVWHDKPYRYNMDVKAGDEIPIQMEWLPHKEDISPEVTKKQKKNKPPTDKFTLVTTKFPPNLTARVDVELASEKADSDIQILSMSDNEAKVTKPDFLNKDSVGYQIQSYAGKLKFITKATADGQITLKLKGMDIRDPKDDSKRVPYWIDYTKFKVNGKKIFDKLISTWHDEPYRYTMDVKADEEVKVQIVWLPHKSDN